MIFRVRAAAIIINHKKEVLMVYHKHPVTGEEWWAFPGGGIGYSESAEEAVKREVLEECGISCNPQKIVYVREFLDNNNEIHHVELFFTATTSEYNTKIGIDPEYKKQMIVDTKFLSEEKIRNLKAKVYPEILLDRFWADLHNNFNNHKSYLGLKYWKNGFVIK